MGFPRVIVATAGALILLAAQAQPVSAREGSGAFAKPHAGPSFAATASSPWLSAPASFVKTRSDSAAVVQKVGFVTAAGVGDGVCRSTACTNQAARQVVDVPAAPTPPNHVLLLAAAGAVAFMASRRHIGG